MRLVTAGLLLRDGRVLVAQRSRSSTEPLKWEFPGGTVEPGERPEACVRRELAEEFGIAVEVGSLVAASEHGEGADAIRLLAYRVRWTGGALTPTVHAKVRWVMPRDALHLDLLPADVPVAHALVAHLAREVPEPPEPPR